MLLPVYVAPHHSACIRLISLVGDADCNQWGQGSNVSGLLQVMQEAFSQRPPVTAAAAEAAGPAAAAASSEAGALPSYRCVKECNVRAGFELNSPKVGVLDVGTELAALEQRVNSSGITRVRFWHATSHPPFGGWASVTSSSGTVCLGAVESAAGGEAQEEKKKENPLGGIILVCIILYFITHQ